VSILTTLAATKKFFLFVVMWRFVVVCVLCVAVQTGNAEASAHLRKGYTSDSPNYNTLLLRRLGEKSDKDKGKVAKAAPGLSSKTEAAVEKVVATTEAVEVSRQLEGRPSRL
jgi:hypothetical protein